MLRELVVKKLSHLKGNIGVYYKNLTTAEEFLISDNDRFMAASIIKIPVMIEFFQQINNGVFTYDTKISLKDTDKVPCSGLINYAEGNPLQRGFFPESGILNFMHENLELTMLDLCILMIVISDNTATNILIDCLGKDNINNTLKNMGMNKTVLNRKLFETGESGSNIENYFSLKELGTILEKIYSKNLISTKASEYMVRILMNQQLNYKIPFFISNLPIAHKTGEDEGITNDVGIIYSENPFILCLAGNQTNVSETNMAFQEIAKDAYEYSNKS